jgi:zinc transport system ATP-binding protein
VSLAVRLRDVSVKRDGNSILESITANFPAGAVTAIVGPNGGGKSTLIHAMLGLAQCSGEVRFDLACGHRPRVGYVPQRLDFDRAAPISVMDFMAMGRQTLPLWFGVRRKVRERARTALDLVHAHGLEDRPLGKLSGGELQRVKLAFALQDRPELVVLDEPVAGVDPAGEEVFCDLLEHIQRSQVGCPLTIVMVSHDLTTVKRHAAQVLGLRKTVQFFGPPDEVLTHANLARAYGPSLGLCRHLVEEGVLPGVAGA